MKKRNALNIIYSALIMIFLYAPIIVMVIFSFNSSRSTSVMTGFSLKWYKELIHDNEIMKALANSLIIAFLSATISTIIGTLASIGIEKFSNRKIKNTVMNVTNVPMMNPDIVTGVSMLLLFVFSGKLLQQSNVLGFATLQIYHR